MLEKYSIYTVLILIIFSTNPFASHAQEQTFLQYAETTLRHIDEHYSVPDTDLYREQYPFDDNYKADYLGTQNNSTRQFAYLWPFSGVLSARAALYEQTHSSVIKDVFDRRALSGLEQYYDTRTPHGYASYIRGEGKSDRFYDDNVWIGIDLTDMYLITREQQYLDMALVVWEFVESGIDSKLGGGIYWSEQSKKSKNTCSNAPGSVFATKLFKATGDKRFLDLGKTLYLWTKENLQDENDFVYFDNINLKGKVDSTKYSYNSGQMIQAAVLLYKATHDPTFLEDARKTAAGSYDFFFKTYPDTDFPRLSDGNIWFHAVMLRGFIELYELDKDKEYINTFKKNLNFAWHNMRDENGLFSQNWSLNKNERSQKWLLNQFAIAEMYARLSDI